MWINSHPGDPRWATLSDELAIGAKSLVLHYAELAGAETKNYRRGTNRTQVNDA
jgi:hypothetical protein